MTVVKRWLLFRGSLYRGNTVFTMKNIEVNYSETKIYSFIPVVGPNLCDPCDPGVSSCTDGLVCSSTTYQCECPPDEVQISDSCCKFVFIFFASFSQYFAGIICT
jgi:hypothetical protein